MSCECTNHTPLSRLPCRRLLHVVLLPRKSFSSTSAVRRHRQHGARVGGLLRCQHRWGVMCCQAVHPALEEVGSLDAWFCLVLHSVPLLAALQHMSNVEDFGFERFQSQDNRPHSDHNDEIIQCSMPHSDALRCIWVRYLFTKNSIRSCPRTCSPSEL